MAEQQVPSINRAVRYQIRPGVYRPALIVEGHGLNCATIVYFAVPEWDATNQIANTRLSCSRGDGVGEWNWPAFVKPVAVPKPAPVTAQTLPTAESGAANSAPVALAGEDETAIRKAEEAYEQGVREANVTKAEEA